MNWYRKWRLRRARERYVAAKARQAILIAIWNQSVWNHTEWNRHRLIQLAGEVAMLEERVETMMRE